MKERRSRDRVEQFYVTRLLRWRLLIALVVCLVGVVIALYDSTPQFELDDLVLAFAVPVLVWILMTLVARILERRVRNEEFLHRYRRFSQELARCHDWDELAQFIQGFPSTLWPGAHSELAVYHQGPTGTELAGWRPPSGLNSLELSAATCSNCLANPLPNPDQANQVVVCSPAVGKGERQGLCVTLSYEQATIGRLHVLIPAGRPLAPDTIKFLEAAAPEMALALALALGNLGRIHEAGVVAQRNERQQIAYALHDSLAQQVGYLHMNLDRLTTDAGLAPDGRIRSELEHMRTVSHEVYQQIREMLIMLRVQDASQLRQGIAHLVEMTGAASALSIDFQVEGDEQPVPAEHTPQVLSVVRECLHNAVKHAQARRVRVGLRFGQLGYSITVADDGHGFDLAVKPRAGHFGLAMMTEQIRALHGEVAVTSAPGQGTQVAITLPLYPAAPEPVWPFTRQSLPLDR